MLQPAAFPALLAVDMREEGRKLFDAASVVRFAPREGRQEQDTVCQTRAVAKTGSNGYRCYGY